MSKYRFYEVFVVEEPGRYIVFKNDIAFPRTGIRLGVVFKGGKHWCSCSFPPFVHCKTRKEAAQRLDDQRCAGREGLK